MVEIATPPEVEETEAPVAPPAAEEAPSFKQHPPLAERYAMGKALREQCPRQSHAAWTPPPDRLDPLKVLEIAEVGRYQPLLPLRHGRMLRSPFTFYRGSALAMAADLASTPTSGIRVQACGDAHMSNFGGFATPERRIIFSVNDLDETLPAPWEWDVKRLAASFVLCCRENGLDEPTARDMARASVRAYREHLADFSQWRTLELWYHSMDLEKMVASLPDPSLRRRGFKRLAKERALSVAQDVFPKLAQTTGNLMVIKDQLPAIFHWEGHEPGEVVGEVREAFVQYRQSLSPAHQALLDRFEIMDAAIKVVGVGSVGTHCWVVLFSAGEGDPLFLQVKEARDSVLAPYAGPSAYPNNGERVVNGYRMMQPYSDIFLGWMTGKLGRDFYVRQLKDCKISIRVETFGAKEMGLYADWCGQALALSHARSGNSAIISGYMGKGSSFDKAVAAFAVAYADQTQQDYEVVRQAAAEGRIQAIYE